MLFIIYKDFIIIWCIIIEKEKAMTQVIIFFLKQNKRSERQWNIYKIWEAENWTMQENKSTKYKPLKKHSQLLSLQNCKHVGI